MSTKNFLVAVICLTLLFAEGTRAEAVRDGAVGPGSDGARRVGVGHQRRAARRRVNKKMSKRTTDGLEVQEGVWGGAHVRLLVREGGAVLEFDCAHGEISETLKTDAEGRFDLPGTFTRESPGPIRVGITPAARPARYVGQIEGRTMTFRVKLTDRNQETEVFTLTRGSEGQLRKCR